MTEGTLKSALFQRLRQDEPAFIVLQLATAGAPDREVVGNKRTSYWECKYGKPQFISHGNQELMCQKLAYHGFHCRYVLWIDTGDEKWTYIVNPFSIRNYKTSFEYQFNGLSHRRVCDYIRQVHRQ